MNPRVRDIILSLSTAGSLLLCYLGYCGVGRVMDAVVEAVVKRVEDRMPKQPAPPPPAPVPEKPPEKPVEKPPEPKPVEPKPPISYEPKRAAVRFTSGSSGCSGTFLRIGSPPRYYLLTAAHCISRVGSPVNIRYEDRTLRGEVLAMHKLIDIALCSVEWDGPPLPVARIASGPPRVGDAAWHKGYGVHIPGNVETGRILTVGGPDAACWYTTRLSSGDSGSGQFRQDNGELIALGCWGSAGRCGGPGWHQITAFLDHYFRGGSKPPPS